MVTTLLLSRAFAAEYGDVLERARKQYGLKFDTLLLNPCTEPPNAAEDLARCDTAMFSRDIRFAPDEFARFGKLTSLMTNLRWMHFGSAGAGPFPWMTPLRARGVSMTSSVGANAEPVAQMALLGMLFLARRMPRWIDNQAAHGWVQQVEPDVPPDLAGQTVIIVGLGNVGTHFARFAKALRMHVIGVRRSPCRENDLADVVAHPNELLALLPRCDWLVLTCPLITETRNLISRDALACMKPTAHLVNVARGEIVDEAALIEALRSGALAGAHLDAFTTEPLPSDSPIWTLPNVLITPHNAASSAGNNRRSAEMFVDNFVRYLHGEPLLNMVPPS